ncbi:MAG: glycosyltransferase [Treponema sp.]|nr:glycosyltransferase [Treponema sp.]
MSIDSKDIKRKVSIITVVYNAVKTIEQTIQSVLSQSYKNIEYIIIDGGSTDGTLDVIEKYRNSLAYFVSESDYGIYDAMNKGIRKASGDIIGLLNADDWYEPKAIEYVVKAKQESNAGIIVGKTFMVDEFGNKWLYMNCNSSEMWKGRMPGCHQATFIEKKVYDTIGLYDTNYKLAADYGFVLQAYHMGIRFFMLDAVVVNYRISGKSSVDNIRHTEEHNAILKRFIAKYPDKISIIEEQCSRNLAFAKFQVLFARRTDLFFSALSAMGISHNEAFVVWGASKWGHKIADILLKNGFNVLYFVDSDKNRYGDQIFGKDVKSPQNLEAENAVVFAATRNFDLEIKEKVKSYRNSSLRCIMLRDIVDIYAEAYDKQTLLQS